MSTLNQINKTAWVWQDGLLALALASVLWLVMQSSDSPDANAAGLAAPALVLLLGLRRGPLVSWFAGLALGLAFTVLIMKGGISLGLFFNCLGLLAACTLFPIPWSQRRDQTLQDFEAQRVPLEERRDFARDQFERVRQEVEKAEQRSREVDALYHAGREISKLLTLQDTLDFCREIIRDTLVSGEKTQEGNEPSFALLLADEESGQYRLGAFGGLSEQDAAEFEAPIGAASLIQWLCQEREPKLFVNVSSEAALKGRGVPPQVRGLASMPLLIEAQVIGVVLVFDVGQGGLSSGELANLRILTSQISIGIEKAMLYDKVQRLSITDGLTGLFVHRHFQSRLEEEIKRAERYNEPLALLMIDIDFFKKFNDVFGHLAGDQVLRRVAAVLKSQVGSSDFAARYGGEEFAVILPRQNKVLAAEVAEKVRAAVEAEVLEFEGQSPKLTVSVGLAAFPEDAMTKKGLVERADGALYQAKHEGRNQVRIA